MARAASAHGSEVVRIRYDVGQDWSGEEALFVRVLLRDSATQRPRLREVAERIRETVYSEVNPRDLGLPVYFNFRGESEQAQIKEDAWA